MSDTEEFWRGEFGDAYTERNAPDPLDRSMFWSRILMATHAKKVLEVGCNRGANLRSLKMVDECIRAVGCDLNKTAINEARTYGFEVAEAKGDQLSKHFGSESFDLVFTAGVLIHVPPEELDATVDGMVKTSREWVLMVEYAASEVEPIPYRGHEGRLWRRPYGDLLKDRGLKLEYIEHPAEGFDNCTAWLYRK